MVTDHESQKHISAAKGSFLNELWEKREHVRSMGSLERLCFYSKRGVETLLDQPLNSLLTTLTLSFLLLIFAGMMLVFHNVNSFLVNIGGEKQFSVYLKDGVDEKLVRELETNILKHKSVDSALYVTKAEALELFSEHLGRSSDLLKGLDKDNPLPASIDVSLKFEGPDITDPVIQKLLKKIEKNSIVSDVSYANEWTEKIHSIILFLQMFGTFALIAAFIMSVFIVATTIQLVLYNRRSEISIMNLIGASEGFIRIPFLIGSLIQGFFGSLFGLMILKIVFIVVGPKISEKEILGLILPEPTFLAFESVLLILFVGSFTGYLGSSLVLRGFIKD